MGLISILWRVLLNLVPINAEHWLERIVFDLPNDGNNDSFREFPIALPRCCVKVPCPMMATTFYFACRNFRSHCTGVLCLCEHRKMCARMTFVGYFLCIRIGE